MIQHPARHFIYYLISRRTNKTAAIMDRLDALGLMPSVTSYLKEQARTILAAQKVVVPPSGFTKDLKSPEAVAFLDKWKIGDFWRGTPEITQARKLLTDTPDIRRAIEIMLLGPINHSDIAARIQKRYGAPPSAVNTAVIRVYAHYFWNTSCMTRSQWIRFIEMWAGDSERVAYLAACNAPRSSSGVTTTLMFAERVEDELDPIATYTTVRNLAFRQFMETSLTASPKVSLLVKSQAALMSLQTMRAAEEELVRLRGVSNNAFLAQLSRFEHKYDHKLPMTATQFLAADNMSESPHGQIIDATVVEKEE
jgi:hypothetical protein